MKSLLVLAALFCPQPKVTNSTDSWTKTDAAQLKFSKKRCGQLYKDAPCLKYFWKVEFQTYRVICGKPHWR